MKTKGNGKMALLGAAIVTCSLAAWADSPTFETPKEEVFRAQELSFDIFGSVSAGQETLDNISGNKISHDGRFGAGIGANYFFTRYFGIGADAYTENTDSSFVDSASANVIGRLPFDAVHLAPYIYGGGGYQFDLTESWFGQAGAGVDIRVTKNWGLFVDGRYVFTDKTSNYGLGRVGVRLAF